MIIRWFSASEADFPRSREIRWGVPTAASRSTGRPEKVRSDEPRGAGPGIQHGNGKPWDRPEILGWSGIMICIYIYNYIYICIIYICIYMFYNDFYFYMQTLSDKNLLWYRGFSIARLNYQRSKSKYGHVLTVEGTILQILHHSDFFKGH